ncbi:hypothetical protein FHX10_003226 [Rhizobium sp. BK591]|uniref:hypothetical protein n=1 Tax=Rhizobium sp. BK591 TaxID=2586985 RepID=UPI0016189740|nr:hypothetical protein [Rhizobium sp. BK591]MBB3743727.1 hypothetical protein [Rhizobium sp. BK591]
MLHKVVAPFPCSWDGITSVDLEIGDERDFGSMADGLVAIGWIEPIKALTPTDGLQTTRAALGQTSPVRRKRK